MNQRRFLHLLNLYIDGEIPSAVAAELEKEIIANPRRRAIYDDYCRIHRGTKLVYERFREAAASQSIESVRLFQTASNHDTATARDSRPWWMSASWLTLIGGGAAAASIALAFMIAGSDPHPGITPPADLAASVETVQPDVEEETAFAAPFAAPVRSDPYVAEAPGEQARPFSLESSAPEREIVWSNASTESQISSPFGLVQPLDQMELAPGGIPTNDASTPGRVFRGANVATPVELEPVGSLIHR